MEHPLEEYDEHIEQNNSCEIVEPDQQSQTNSRTFSGKMIAAGDEPDYSQISP